MGAIFTAVVRQYPGQEARATDLITYPTLFMGIGNLVSMPLALALGRRPVFLASMALLVASGAWCAYSQSLGSHIAGRDIMSLAAGQSEALVPLMVQEIHFLHEKGRRLSWFVLIQNIAVGCFFIATQFLVASYGWRWWYGLFTIINGVILVLSAIFVAETAFDRTGKITAVQKTTKTQSVTGQRFADGLKIVNIKPRFDKIPSFYFRLIQGLAMPGIIWALLTNGIFLGMYVFCSGTFATTLVAKYQFSFTSLAYVQGSQMIDAIIFLPLLGYGGDYLIKLLSKRNNSFYKPEYRLFPLAIPAIVGVVTIIVFGQASIATNNSWHWYDIAIAYTAVYFGFLGANIVGITYTIDSFPTRAGPLLVLLCAGRGIISFGLSYSVLPAIQTLGYGGSTVVFGALAAAFSAMAIPLFLFGPRIRAWCAKTFGVDKETEEYLD